MTRLVTIEVSGRQFDVETAWVGATDVDPALPIIVSALVWVFLCALVMGGGLLATSGWHATTARRDELSWITLSGCVSVCDSPLSPKRPNRYGSTKSSGAKLIAISTASGAVWPQNFC